MDIQRLIGTGAPGRYSARVESRIRQGGYSEFFRTRGMNHFWHQLSFYLLATRPPRQTSIKIVVVGCSTGEETYSLAMWAKTAGLDKQVSLKIVGIDRDPARIATASGAKYKKSDYIDDPAFSVPDQYRPFFIGLQGNGNDFLVKPEIRSMVNFALADILGEMPEDIRDADIVVAHNLIIDNLSEHDVVLPAVFRLAKKGGLIFINKESFSQRVYESIPDKPGIVFSSETDVVLRF